MLPATPPRLAMPLQTFSVAAWIGGLLLNCLIVEFAIAQVTPASTRGRRLAPDVLEVIKPGHEYGDTMQGPVDLPFVAGHPDLAWSPNTIAESDTLLEMGKGVRFRVDVYGLEFAFKPARMIEVEMPTAEGFRRKNVWYLLYRVRYVGGDYQPIPEADPHNNKVFTTESVSTKWVRFMPQFTLDAKGIGQYREKLSAVAKAAIAARERVGQPIYDSIEMQKLKIEISTPGNNHEYWGVATWHDLNPHIDFFTIEVRGLTNAQRIEQLPDGTLDYQQKSLVLYFSRPGDAVNELLDEIRYGIPAIEDQTRQKYVLDQFGVEKRLDYQWLYR